MQKKLIFSGHDTFHCRLFWLKKGYDFISTEGKFKDDSGVELGVGRNMVTSIRFWLKSFGIIDDDYQINAFYQNLLSEDGWDPYLENEATLQLLHYQLCAMNHSSIYNLIFNELRKVKPEFTKRNFVNYVLGKNSKLNESIIEKDFSVFLRMYGPTSEKNIEDGYNGLLTELGLLNIIGENQNKEKLYRIENQQQKDIPNEILLYCILSNDDYGKSISFKNLYSSKKGVANIFCLDQDTLDEKLEQIANDYPSITYSMDSGIKELQIKEDINPMEILEGYYA